MRSSLVEYRFMQSVSSAPRDLVWSYGFVYERNSEGRAIRILVIIDEYSRQCQALEDSRMPSSEEVMHRLNE